MEEKHLIDPQEDKQEEAAQKKQNGFTVNLYDFASVMSAAVIVIAIVFSFVFRFVGVVGSSMVDTLHDGDWLIVSAYDHQPQYGKVVIITQPNAFNEPIVKRVIATQGQQVDIDFTTGDVSVDGQKLNEPYINNPTTTSGDVTFPLTVPDGHVFVMGDNRQHSSDSRFSQVGLIDERYILGQVKYKIMRTQEINGKNKLSYYPFGEWKVH